MAKRKQLQPWPDTVWFSSGRVRESRVLDKIRTRIEKKIASGDISDVRFFTSNEGKKGVDTTWRTSDGARIKARLVAKPNLMLYEQEFPEEGSVTDAAKATRVEVDTFWKLTAEADCPWRLDWPSPMDVLFGDMLTYDWLLGQMPMRRCTRFEELEASTLAQLLVELGKCSWHIPVITHDRDPFNEDDESWESLVHLLPSSVRGRLLELRVHEGQDQIVNAEGVLPESRLRLKWGGAVIVPPKPRPEEWALADGIIRRPPGATFDELLKETAAAVTRYAELHPPMCEGGRAMLEDLRSSWVLPDLPLAPERVMRELREVKSRAVELEEELEEAERLLREERESARLAHAAKEEAQQRLREIERNPLSEQAKQFRADAETAWAAEERAQTEVEDLAREVGYLRRQLAQVPGRSYSEPVPDRPKGPDTWNELFELASELMPHVRILDRAQEPVKALRGHSLEKAWLRRTWEALEALDAYGGTKKEIGVDILPHFSAYLGWPQATTVIPKSMYCAAEVLLERGGADLRVRRTRLFTVPELGEVFMGAHIRIGGGRPPAPRMHFYDDTSGTTGKTIIGYIGPHLPNSKGR